MGSRTRSTSFRYAAARAGDRDRDRDRGPWTATVVATVVARVNGNDTVAVIDTVDDRPPSPRSRAPETKSVSRVRALIRLTPAMAKPTVVALALLSGCYSGVDARATADDASVGEANAETTDTASDTADTDDTGGTVDPQISECRQPTHEIFQRLAPTCVGCHDEGTTVPLAADFVSFEQLVVYNTDLITFGEPERSPLLDMLAGTAAPPLEQMPPVAVSFAELAELGATEIGMDELARWIEDLEPCDTPGGSQSPRFARRVSVEQIHAALMDQLDLTLDDVEHGSRLPLDDPSFPAFVSGHNSRAGAQARWRALGGPDYLAGDGRNSDFGPLFIQTVGPIAQTWCRRSIVLGRDALFRHVGPDSRSETDEAAIRDNIRFLFLEMLGMVATDEDVDAMYRSVYLPYESAEDSRTAWVAVCSAFVRHPLWLTD